MKRINTWLLFLYCLLTCFNSLAAISNPLLKQTSSIVPAEQAFHLFAEKEGSHAIQLRWEIAPQTYLYQSKMQITSPNAPALFEYTLPQGESYTDLNFGEQIIYRNALAITLKLSPQFLETTHNQTYQYFNVDYQGCHTQGFCYPPQTQSFRIAFQQGGISVVEPIYETMTQVSPEAEPVSQGFFDRFMSKLDTRWGWAIFYLLGILLGFTPCVLPMLPILAGIIAGPALTNHPRKAFRLTLVYVLSIAVTYALAGIATAKLGASLQGELQRPVYIILFACLFIYLGLSQVGLLPIGLPTRLQNHLNNLQQKQSSGTYMGAFLLGILATLLASPCVTAPLVAVLSFIAQTGNIWFGGLSLLMLGLGMGTVLLIAGTLGSQLLPKAGTWMHRINQLIAVMLFGLSIWMISRILPASVTLGAWGVLCIITAYLLDTFHLRLAGIAPRIGSLFLIYGLILFLGASQGHTSLLAPLNSKPWHSDESQSLLNSVKIHSQDELALAFEAAKKTNKPILLDFYADWCISCQHLENTVFRDHDIHYLLEDFYIIKADITHFNNAEKTLMRQYNVIAPPTLIFFNPAGKEMRDYRIIGEISIKTMKEHLENVIDIMESSR